MEAQGNDNQTVKQNKLEENTRKSAEFETKLQKINEEIAVATNQLVDEPKTKTNLSKLEKLEAKIDNNIK